MRRALTLLLIPAMLAGCAEIPPPATGAPAPARAPVDPGVGVERIIGHPVGALVQLFGEPDFDLREGATRKLQFSGPACVLDVYLVPPAQGRGEPVVRYVDARSPGGEDFDRASCIAALRRRPQAR